MTTNQKFWVFLGIACALVPNSDSVWLEFFEVILGVGFFIASIRYVAAIEDKL